MARLNAEHCEFSLRLSVLDPPVLAIDSGRSSFLVELRRVPGPAELKRKSAALESIEVLLEDEDRISRLRDLACARSLANELASDFALAGELSLAKLAQAKAKRAEKAGAALIATIKKDEAIDLAARFPGQNWLLAMLPGGDDLLIDLAKNSEPESWGRTNTLAALTVYSKTRERTLSILAAIPRRDQIDVMHEIFHSQDNMRPWVSNYALDADRDLEFVRVYRVFRGIAFRLWDLGKGPETTLAAFFEEAENAQLDREWKALLFEYYGRNILGLHQSRPRGMAVVDALLESARKLDDARFAPLKARLEEIRSNGRLDAISN